MKLMFCEYEMGILEKKENGYVYNSNIANEKYLREHDYVCNFEYSLWDSCQRINSELFWEFEAILKRILKRQDILQRAGVLPTDSKWIKLEKISKLKFNPSGFYVKYYDD